jgi:hypothetical protein
VFIFNLNVVFTMHFLKIALSRVGFCLGFPPGAGFPGEEFAPAGSQSGEKCSRVLLAPRWSREKPVFTHVVSSS